MKVGQAGLILPIHGLLAKIWLKWGTFGVITPFIYPNGVRYSNETLSLKFPGRYAVNTTSFKKLHTILNFDPLHILKQNGARVPRYLNQARSVYNFNVPLSQLQFGAIGFEIGQDLWKK